MRFKEKIAIVTGGASGQGLETCKRLASEGALVIVADWNGEGAKRTADEIGGKAFQVNVAHESEVAAMIDFAISSHRRLDILINNAGIGYSATGQYTMASVVRTPEADWDAILAINLKGVAMGLQARDPDHGESGRRRYRQHSFDQWHRGLDGRGRLYRSKRRRRSPDTCPRRGLGCEGRQG